MATEGWEAATWDGARRAQSRDQARLSPEQRLRWLEAAIRFAAAAAAAPRAAGSAPPPGDESGGP